MEKTLNILAGALPAAVGLQIIAAGFLRMSVNYIELLKNVDLTALQTAFSLTPFWF